MQTARVSAFRFPNFTSSKFQDPPPPPTDWDTLSTTSHHQRRSQCAESGSRVVFCLWSREFLVQQHHWQSLLTVSPKTVVILQLLSSFYKKKRGLLIIKIMLTDTTQYFFVKVVKVFINRENSQHFHFQFLWTIEQILLLSCSGIVLSGKYLIQLCLMCGLGKSQFEVSH